MSDNEKKDDEKFVRFMLAFLSSIWGVALVKLSIYVFGIDVVYSWRWTIIAVVCTVLAVSTLYEVYIKFKFKK